MLGPADTAPEPPTGDAAAHDSAVVRFPDPYELSPYPRIEAGPAVPIDPPTKDNHAPGQ